jgi:Holliday junction resolvase
MTEQKYQKTLIDEYREKGYYVIKLIKTNVNGIPDLLCLKIDEPPIFVEVKTKKGRLSKLQEYRINELQKRGFIAIVDKEE